MNNSPISLKEENLRPLTENFAAVVPLEDAPVVAKETPQIVEAPQVDAATQAPQPVEKYDDKKVEQLFNEGFAKIDKYYNDILTEIGKVSIAINEIKNNSVTSTPVEEVQPVAAPVYEDATTLNNVENDQTTENTYETSEAQSNENRFINMIEDEPENVADQSMENVEDYKPQIEEDPQQTMTM